MSENATRLPHAGRQPVSAPPRPWLTGLVPRYAAAVLSVVIAWALRLAIDPVLREVHPFTFFFVPVLLLGWWAGVGPASLAAGLGWLVADWFFCPPRHSILAGGAQEVTASLVYLLFSAGLITVTQHLRQARTLAEQSEQRFRLFMDHTPALAWVKDELGRYVYLNQAYERRFGVSLAASQGKTDDQLWPPEVAARLRQADQVALAAGRPVEFTEETTEANGTTSFWFNTKFAFHDPAGHRFLASIGLDITAQRQAEERLRQSEQKFRAIFEQAALGIGLVRFSDARWIDVNEPFCRSLGYPPEFMRTTPWPQITHPDDVDLDLIPFRRMAAGELNSYSVEKRFLHQDGHPVWTRLTLSLVRDAQGRPDYEIAIIENIEERKRTEAALMHERAFIEAVLQACPAGIIVADRTGKLVRMNPANQNLWGMAPFSGSVEEYREWKGWWADGSARQGRRLEPHEWALARALRGEVCPGDLVEIEPFGAPGVRRTMVNSGAPVRSPTGEILGAVIVQIDITSLKQAEEKLRASEERLRKAISTPTVGALFFNLEGQIHDANAAFQRMSGYRLEELRQIHWKSLTAPEGWESTVRTATGLAQRGEAVPYEKPMVRKDGSRWWGLFAPTRLSGSGPHSECMEFIIDITERKDAAEALRQSEAKFRSLFAHSPDAIFLTIPDGRITAVNPAACALFGMSEEELLRAGRANLIDPADPGHALALEERARTGQFHRDLRYLRKNGERFTAETSSVMLGGEPLHCFVILRDITERKRAEAALRQSELNERHRADELAAAITARDEAFAQLNALLANAPIGFAFFDRQHRFARINHFLAGEIDGLPADAHLGRRVREVLPATAQAIEPLLQTIFACGSPVENVVITADTPTAPGRQRHWLTAWFPVKTPDGRIPWVGAAVMDITRHKRIEADLQRRNRHLALLHQAAASLLLGRKPVDLLAALQEQIATTFGAEVFMLYEAAPENGHLELKACGGLSPQEEHQLQKLRYGRAVCAKPAEALHPIIATHLQSREAPNRRFVRKLGFHSYLYYPLLINHRLEGTLAFASRHREDFDEADLEFFQTIARTLAEALERHRLESELQRHAEDLERIVAERTARLRETIAELEGFSYSLVHDMRAPLRAMQSYAGILQEEAGPRLRPDESDLLDKIRVASTRMDHLITDSLNYSRILREDLPLGSVNLGALLRGMVDTYPNLHPPQADITVEFGDLQVHGNQAALTQVFSNLLGNAVKFVAPGVHPRVRVWAELVDSGELRVDRPRTAPQSSTTSGYPLSTVNHQLVRVCVQDNGIGIPQDAHEKIFGMFQRMHRIDEYPGTGIGLALVKKSLERTGGHITLTSEPGKGSCFCVDLPLAARDEAQEIVAAPGRR